MGIIKDELEFERGQLMEELHQRTLERIFIEERIYKKIEQMKTAEAVNKAVIDGFKPFKKELLREITDEDVERLLKIPIRRISLFDINKNRDEVAAINGRLKEIARRLKHLTDCAVEYLNGMLDKFKPEELERHTQIAKFSAVDVKTVATRDTPLRYDDKGYIGIGVSGGTEVLRVTPYDRIFVMRKSGIYTVCDVPQKLFVDAGMVYVNYAEKEIRCIMNRDYFIAPDGMEVLHVDTRKNFKFTLHYAKKARAKVLKETFKTNDYIERGLKAQGFKLSTKEVESVEVE